MDSDHTELIPMSDPGESFDVVLRGYDRGQVEEHVDRLETVLRTAAADRDATAARSADLASQLATAHAEIESLRVKLERTGLPTFENMGERIAGMLRLAEAEANAIRAKAAEDTTSQRAELSRLEGEIGTIRAAAERDAAALITETEERAAAIRRDADGYSAGVRGDADEHARRVREEAQTRARALVTDAQTERDQAGSDFEVALRARRTEESRADQDRRARSVTDAQQRIAAAEEQAGRLVAEARQQVERLIAVRRQVLDQLAAVGRLVADIPGQAGISGEDGAGPGGA